MKTSSKNPFTRTLTPSLVVLGLVAMLLFGRSLTRSGAQVAVERPAAPAPAAAASTNESDRPSPPPSPPPAPDKPAASTNLDAQPKSEPPKTPPSGEITVSFQAAPIDLIVQWLAQTTGKSVVKHPQVQCQMTIVSSKKVKPREAITLVYRALALEGFAAIESSDSILIVPEGKEPRINPELLDPSRKDIPEGRQRLVKMFSLDHAQAADLRDKVRLLLSDKGTIDVDDRANRLIITDFNENLRSAAELIKVLDIVSDSDSTVEFYPLKFADAEELGSLLSLIVNAQAPPPPSSGSSTRSSSSSGSSPRSSSSGSIIITGGSPPDMPSSSSSSSPPSASSSGASAPIRIWPDKTANRLIVFAPKAKLPEVQRLIKLLDTDKPADVAARVLPLKNVNAVDLVKDIGPLYQKMSGKSGKDLIEVAASDRANALIVLSSEANFRAFEKLIAALDTEDAQDKVVKTFPLKNADAEDVAKQLQELNRDQDNSSRYPFFIFSSSSSQGKPSRKMSVVADRRRNSLVIQAPPSQMEGIEKMIQELDEPVTDNSLAPRIYALKYVSAVDIEDVLNELFLKKTQQRNYFSYYGDFMEPQADRDVGRLYGKVRITSEPYANAIIVTSNSKESLAVVEDVLKQLDRPSEAGESTLRVGLKFAKASIVANSINILFAKNGSPPLRQTAQQNQPGAAAPQQQPQQSQASASQTGYTLERETKEDGYYPWLGGQPDNFRTGEGRNATRPVSDLVGRVRAVADERSNGLLVSANVHFFPQILKLIEELDAPTDQVLIEARLIEVSSDFLDKLGVRWSPNGSQVFTADDYDNSILGHTRGDYQKGFGGNTAVNNPPSGSAQLAQTLTSLRSGVVDSSISIDFLVQFMRKHSDAKVLAEPQINIRDNETGRLFVGQKVPTLTASQNSGSIGLSQSFVYMDVGVILEVTPHINSKGDVELKIHAESSTVVPGQTVLGGVVIDSRAFKTYLTAKDGQTLVLGGIIQKQVSDTLRKTPILGDIPGLGWAFKKKDKSSHEVELMVFLRPKVTRTPEDAKDLLDRIYRKAPNVKEWNEDNEPSDNQEKGKQSSGR